jgi:hypothetical protein
MSTRAESNKVEEKELDDSEDYEHGFMYKLIYEFEKQFEKEVVDSYYSQNICSLTFFCYRTVDP